MIIIKYYLILIFIALSVTIEAAPKTPDEIVADCGEQSCEFVFRRMKRFAKNGSPHAQAVLSILYRGGFGTEVNEARSLSLMKKAAKNGLAFAQFDLAKLYRVGFLVEKDQEESDRWLSKAGKSAYQPAMKLLISDNKLSKEEIQAYKEKTNAYEPDDKYTLLTVTRPKYTLTDLMGFMKLEGYGRSNQTGSRIKGLGCGNSMVNCAIWKINTPLGRTQFGNTVSVFNTNATGRIMLGGGER